MFCNSNRRCGDINCPDRYYKTFASHVKAECWSSRNEITPLEVAKLSTTKYWFDCNKCGHEFEKRLSDVVGNHWCSFCENLKLCGDANCNYCFEKSFASQEKYTFWRKGNKILPLLVFKNSKTKYLFDCNACKHEFSQRLSDITSNGSWCTFCTGNELCSSNLCDFCYKKSFESSDKAKNLSLKNNVTPRDVILGSNQKYLFDCDACGHEDTHSLYGIKSGYWCSYCTNLKLCDDINCKICFAKSFSSSSNVHKWSDNDELAPRQVFKSSGLYYLIVCDTYNKEYSQQLNNLLKGNGCPYYVNKTEVILYDFLACIYVYVQHKFSVD